MKELKFNSQICTTKEQSQRLLELGLKPETADMHITNMSIKGFQYIDQWQIGSISYKDVMSFWAEKGLKLENASWEIIPAWSLHRLIELGGFNVECKGLFWRITGTYFSESCDKLYDTIIDSIETLITENLFKSACHSSLTDATEKRS